MAAVPDECAGQFGPQLAALIAYLTVVCRLPRLVVQRLLADVLQIPLSLGSTQHAWEEASAAVAAPYKALRQALANQPVLNAAETGHRTNGATRWLWTLVAPTVVFYTIATSRGADVLRHLLGTAFAGVLGSAALQLKDFEVAQQPLVDALRCLGAQLAISVNNCPPPRDPRSRMTSFKRTQRKYVQKAYRVRNWREYETGLRARGSLTVWLGLTDGKLANWNSPRPTRRKPGRQRQYSNHAIETTVTLGLVFGLASRQTEGFLRSLLTLLNLDNDVPDHSTISRRKARLGKVASYERRTVKPVHLLIDSSGLSVHVGQLRTPPKARDYRKLHLAVDEQTSDVVACELTSKRARDASRVASLVGQIERPIASAKADAAYDTGDVYKTLENHRAHRSPKVLIPPRTGAQLALDSAGTRQRNRNIRARSRVGKRKWYVASGYSRRSKVETTFHRYKAILGSAMRARGLASQRVEVRLGCKILNTMTALGIPDGEMIG